MKRRYSDNWKSERPQKTTCSYLTGTANQICQHHGAMRTQYPNIRYLDSKSLVLRMMNFMTSPPSSFNFFSLAALTSSLAIASRPRMIAFSKFLRKSPFEPRKFGLAKLRREKYSERSFWMGVPVRITRRFTSSWFNAWKVRDSGHDWFQECVVQDT